MQNQKFRKKVNRRVDVAATCQTSESRTILTYVSTSSIRKDAVVTCASESLNRCDIVECAKFLSTVPKQIVATKVNEVTVTDETTLNIMRVRANGIKCFGQGDILMITKCL